MRSAPSMRPIASASLPLPVRRQRTGFATHRANSSSSGGRQFSPLQHPATIIADTWPSETITKFWAFPAARRPTRSRRRTASSSASTTPTSTRTTSRRRRSSRKSRRRTTSCPTTTKRRNYDQFGHAGVGAGGGRRRAATRSKRSAGRSRAAAAATGGRWRGGPGVTVEEFDFGDGGAGGDFGDIFEQLFGARRRRRGGAAAAAHAARRAAARAAARRRRRAPRHPHLRAGRPRHDAAAPDQPRRQARNDRREDPRRREGRQPRPHQGQGPAVASGEPGDLFIITHVHAAPLLPPRRARHPARPADQPVRGAARHEGRSARRSKARSR